ncbi:hypothetical protein WMY93_004718 [Mugilogobius chulae]|uniref:C2 domain-containing protein n=1 Tax=Mugilogobius chulae TaxID=88201 RepID=A0AAW0PQG9_9GOBI
MDLVDVSIRTSSLQSRSRSFCLPPRLCKSPSFPLTHPYSNPQITNPERRTPAEGLALTRLYERPNTRRKESLFHAKRPVYLFDRSPGQAHPPQPRTTPRAMGAKRSVMAPQTGSFTSFSESPSSSDSSPVGSPCMLRGAASCPALTQSHISHSDGKRSPSGLSPPVISPLDMLHCWTDCPQHKLLLEGHGIIRFSIEHYHTLATPLSPGRTVQLRVASVEGVSALSCALHVCLMPGKKQRQRSATIRQSRVTYRFNEDFFFTELSEEELQRLELRVKVVDKVRGAGLRKVALVGMFTKPLSQLLVTKQ